MSDFSSQDRCWTECAICHRAIERVEDSTGAPLELRRQGASNFFHAHTSCAIARDDARRIRETLDLMQENGALHRRVAELEAQLAEKCPTLSVGQMANPHDADGDDDQCCPNRRRLVGYR